jgi:hypothetical protein
LETRAAAPCDRWLGRLGRFCGAGADVTARERQKLADLERLASNRGAAPGERDNALAAAKRLRARLELFGEPAPASPPPRPAPQWGHVESRGDVNCWVGPPPTHGPYCSGGGEGSSNGCGECALIIKWRRWLQGQAA